MVIMGFVEFADITIRRRKAKLSTSAGKCTAMKLPFKGLA
jgi:hypothetical protein